MLQFSECSPKGVDNVGKGDSEGIFVDAFVPRKLIRRLIVKRY